MTARRGKPRLLPSISAARNLSPSQQQTLLAYLHLLHMQEFIHAPGSYYRNYQYHWLLPPSPNSRSSNWGRVGWGSGGAHWL